LWAPDRLDNGGRVLEKVLMTLVIALSAALFARRARTLTELLRLGRDAPLRPRRWGHKLTQQLVVVLGQRKLLQWSLPGAMHALIF